MDMMGYKNGALTFDHHLSTVEYDKLNWKLFFPKMGWDGAMHSLMRLYAMHPLLLPKIVNNNLSPSHVLL